MSTKNVAPNIRVYDRLARYKRDSESFSGATDRLLAVAEGRHAGPDIPRGLGELPALSEVDARTMLDVIDRDRAAEAWDRDPLR